MKMNWMLNKVPLFSAAMAAMLCGLSGTQVLAETPVPFKMDNATLGRLDAVLTVCSKADPKNKPAYDRYRNNMIEFGTGEHTMRVEGSGTPEYKAAYAEVLEAAGKSTREDLASQCVRTVGLEAAGDPAP